MNNSHFQIESRQHAPELSASFEETPSLATPAQTVRRVLFIAHQYEPSLEMGARSCVQIARYLPRHGWSPVVLTVEDKYIEDRYRARGNELNGPKLPDAIVRTGRWPHPLDLYRWLRNWRKPQTGGSGTNNAVATSATNTTEAGKSSGEKGSLRRLLLSLLSIPDLYTGWIFPAIFAGLKAVRQTGAQQIFSSGPFWTNHLVGFALSHLTGLPWTAHFRDPWVAGIWGQPTSAISFHINRWLERLAVTHAAAVISVTEEHAAAFRQTYPHLPADKFATVSNGYDNAEWENLPRDESREESGRGKFLIAYTGTFYIERDPQPLFRALRAMVDAGEISREQVQVDLVGWCSTSEGRSVSEMAAAHGLSECVNILGPRSRPETLRRMRQADLLLLLAERFVIQIPGKTYEYLRAGRPILALTSEGSLANLLRRIGGGWVVDPTDDAGILAALRESVQEWKEGGITRVADPSLVASFDRCALAGRMAELFNRLA